MTPVRRVIRPCGRTAFLVELPGLDDVVALHAELSDHPLPGQVEVLAAAATVMVRASSPRAAARLARQVSAMRPTARDRRAGGLVEIDVCYDGEDLDAVAEILRCSRQAVIAAHTGQLWTAAFGGFAPGFSYCIGQNHSLDVARRRTPRTAVPAGSVGLAGPFSAVYPRSTPGGWQLIGRSAAIVWDAGRQPPALIAPGSRVRYRAVRELIEVIAPHRAERPAPQRGLRVLSPGPQSLITDLGRPGNADLGVAESGAMDRGAARLANALLGNPVDAAVIENLAGGLRVAAVGDLMVAVTGARVPLTVQPGTGPAIAPVPARPACEQALRLMDGQTLTLGSPEAGLRAYLGVRGGLDAPLVLGSASTDVMSGVGPEPLRAGQLLPVAGLRWAVEQPPGRRSQPLPGSHAGVRIVLGPRDDWFSPAAIASLLSQRWRLGDDSNRIGLRLAGRPLERVRRSELASEGAVAGSIQVTTAGTPVVLMRDHPVTGGYPVIGVVVAADLDILAQLRPGATVSFECDGSSQPDGSGGRPGRAGRLCADG